MRTAALFVLLPCVALWSCSRPPTNPVAVRAAPTESTRMDETDRAVLAAVLTHEFRQDQGDIVLEDRTVAGAADREETVRFGLRKGWMKPVRHGEPERFPDESTLAAWLRRNQEAVPLPPVAVGRKVTLISAEERDRVMERGWPAFYKRYPHSTGLTRVSLPGYSNDRTEAVLLLANQRQGRWGHGTLFHLTNDEGEWRVRGTMGLWVS